MASRRDEDVESARARIAQLEKALAAARAKPTDRKTDPYHMENLRAIDRINEDLGWARRRLSMLENAAREREIKTAAAETPAAVRLFEITTPDNRKTRQSALNADDLRKRLNKDYEITGEVFIGGYVKPISGPSAMFDGWIEAHGAELLAWLSEQGVVIRREAPPRD